MRYWYAIPSLCTECMYPVRIKYIWYSTVRRELSLATVGEYGTFGTVHTITYIQYMYKKAFRDVQII
jgi:hypothetical protein